MVEGGVEGGVEGEGGGGGGNSKEGIGEVGWRWRNRRNGGNIAYTTKMKYFILSV